MGIRARGIPGLHFIADFAGFGVESTNAVRLGLEFLELFRGEERQGETRCNPIDQHDDFP